LSLRDRKLVLRSQSTLRPITGVSFSETDFTGDLAKFDVPTLVLHGEDDQIVTKEFVGW
jgi:pimeloyl-ACP methyl ester carboxylesterase